MDGKEPKDGNPSSAEATQSSTDAIESRADDKHSSIEVIGPFDKTEKESYADVNSKSTDAIQSSGDGIEGSTEQIEKARPNEKTSSQRIQFDQELDGEPGDGITLLPRPPRSGHSRTPSAMDALEETGGAFAVYKGSYGVRSGRHSKVPSAARSVFSDHSDSKRPRLEQRESYLRSRLEKVFQEDMHKRETYGITELREGFFDAIFVPPTVLERDTREALERPPTLSTKDRDPWTTRLRKRMSSAIVIHAPSQHDIIRLTKAFLAYFACYSLCLIHPTSIWLGRYCYFAPLVSIINHPARSSGSQLEISLQSLLGTALGLGWGSLGLYISTSTPAATNGYGGIHATSVILCLVITTWFRSAFVRLHHFLNLMFLNVFFLEVVDTNERVDWHLTWEIGIPSLAGTLVSLVINLVLFPDFSHRSLFGVLESGLQHCQTAVRSLTSNDGDLKSDIQNQLSMSSQQLSEEVREVNNEIIITTLRTAEIVKLRNTMQIGMAVIGFVPFPASLYVKGGQIPAEDDLGVKVLRTAISQRCKASLQSAYDLFEECRKLVSYLYRGEPQDNFESTLGDKIRSLENATNAMTAKYTQVSRRYRDIFDKDSQNQDLFDILIHMYYLNKASMAILAIGKEFHKIAMHRRRWSVSWPIYPTWRALRRTSKQIIHDRGGQTAVYYSWAKRDVDEIFQELARMNTPRRIKQLSARDIGLIQPHSKNGFRYRLWEFLHVLQGEETRFSVRSAVSVGLLCLPGWLKSNYKWYNVYDAWLAPLMVFLISHTRVGGSATDLMVRTMFCLAGSIWAGIGYRAGNGNPYILGVFCATFVLPCLYRFICSSHPRSGLISCICFTVVSLALYTDRRIGYDLKIFTACWTRALSCEIGVAVAVLVNRILWPFTARTEVRKSMSTLLSHISMSFQLVTDRFVYRDRGDDPDELSLQLSEIRENRIMRSMFAFRELLELTKHELSLRDFDRRPYAAMLESCQALFQSITASRRSAIHFNVYDSDGKKETTVHLMPVRRDVIASAIFVLYILAGAFRSQNLVPKYLPSTGMSRKILFDEMFEMGNYNSGSSRFESYSMSGDSTVVDVDHQSGRSQEYNNQILWRVIHITYFSKAYTRIAEEVEKLTACSKCILGETTQ
jgi:hypothetical protein